jgi:glycosyltransferase involved in cell wall biosynthesis
MQPNQQDQQARQTLLPIDYGKNLGRDLGLDNWLHCDVVDIMDGDDGPQEGEAVRRLT